MDLFQTDPINYCFNYNIEQVYKTFVCYNITAFLKKKGLLRFVNFFPENFDENSDKELLLDDNNTFVISVFPRGTYKSLLEKYEVTPSKKKVKYVFKTFNGAPLNYTFNFVLILYEVTESNSTIASFYIECSQREKYFAITYNHQFPVDFQLSIFEDYQKFLSHWNNSDIIMESIFIHSNANEVYKEIISGNAFLSHPYFKDHNLTVKRKEGLIGSCYLLSRKDEKVKYIIKSIQETADCISVTFKKKTEKSHLNREIQFILIRLDEKLSMIQLYLKINLSIQGYYFKFFKEYQQKFLIGIKKALKEEI